MTARWPATGAPPDSYAESLEERSGRGRPGDLIAVLFLDLDGFKDVNDRFGHDAGSDLLVAVAAKLSRCV